MPADFNLNEFLMRMAALVICITIHEFAHAYSAYRAGDNTPKLQGRISLNPLDHLDPFGTIMIVVSNYAHVGFGWGKPVMVNHLKFRHPRRDNLMVSLWGPLSNILTAVVTGTALRFLEPHMGKNVADFIWIITLASIGLAIFNLIPIAPLDGSHIISSMLPYESARRYDYFMARYGMLMFLGLIFLAPDVLWRVIGPPRAFLVHLLTGYSIG